MTTTNDKFEGLEVIANYINITGANFHLTEALASDTQTLHLGDTITVVVECEVTKVRHEPVKDADGLARVHILKAELATIVDSDLVAGVLDDQREKNLTARERAQGLSRLPLDDGIDALIDAHERGMHGPMLVDRCPICAEEADLDEAGR